jgi:hypothetical protein
MKLRSSIIALIVIVSSNCFSITLVYNYFWFPHFPPTGWSLQTTGTGWNWLWTDDGPPYNGYTHGTVGLTSQGQSGSIMLITGDFLVPGKVLLQINFCCRNNWFGAEPANYSWEVSLRDGTNTYWSIELPLQPYFPAWQPNTCLIWIDDPSDQYNVTWKVSGTYGSSPSTLYFDVDEVSILYNDTVVYPVSLGQIKANYTK